MIPTCSPSAKSSVRWTAKGTNPTRGWPGGCELEPGFDWFVCKSPERVWNQAVLPGPHPARATVGPRKIPREVLGGGGVRCAVTEASCACKACSCCACNRSCAGEGTF